MIVIQETFTIEKKMKSVDNFHPDLMKDVRVALDSDRSLK